MTRKKLPSQVLERIDYELQQAHEKKPVVFQRWARVLGISVQTMYRHYRRHKHKYPETIDQQTLEKIASVKLFTFDKKGDSLCTQDAIDELKHRGIIPEQFDAQRGTVDRLMRKHGVDIPTVTQESPAVHLVSFFPNQVHEVDATVAPTFYLNHFGRVAWDPFARGRKIPRGNRDLRLILYSGWDHYSSCLYAKYFLAPAENSTDLFQFLYEYWSPKKDSALPFHGFPTQFLYTDQGGIWKSKSIESLMERLGKIVGFVHEKHEPGAARATGGVESSFRTLKVFEKRLRMRCRTGENPQLDELNTWLYEFLVDVANDKTGRWHKNGMPRAKLWLEKIQTKMLRTPPPFLEFVKMAYVKGETRQINKHVEIPWQGKTYYLPGLQDCQGQEVQVWHGFHEAAIYVEFFSGEIFGPFYPGRNEVPFGTYRRPALTRFERKRRELKEIAGELLGVSEDYGYEDPTYVRQDNVLHVTPEAEKIEAQGEVMNAQYPIQQSFTPDEGMLYIAMGINIYWHDVPSELRDFIATHLEDMYLKSGTITRDQLDELCRRLEPVLEQHGLTGGNDHER